MRNGHVLSSVLILYLYLCFLICGFSNCTNNPKINSADSEEVFDSKSIISSKGILKNGVSSTFALGTKVATRMSERKFLRQRLLYSSNGSQSFNPVIIQIILSGDVHPHPGPNSKQKQNSRSGQDPKENHSTASVDSQHANSCIKIAHLNIRSLKVFKIAHLNIRSLKVFANTFFFYNIPWKNMTLIYLLYQRLGLTRRLIIKSWRFLDLYSSAKIGDNINLVAALQYTSETHSKRHS